MYYASRLAWIRRESSQYEHSQAQLPTAAVIAAPCSARSASCAGPAGPHEARRETSRRPSAGCCEGPVVPHMGQLFSSLWGSLFGSGRELKIVMVGLDNAGKTTVLYRMSLGQTIETTATVGSNVEQIRHGSLTFEVCLAPLTCTACPKPAPAGLGAAAAVNPRAGPPSVSFPEADACS